MNEDLRERLHQFVHETFVDEDDILQFVRQEIVRHGLPRINLDPSEGRLMQVLVAMSGAKKVVEIGTLAGYSAIWIARSLPADGRLITVELSSKHAEIARSHFKKAGLDDRVTVYQGDATEVLGEISADAPFDLVFIDADKPGYPTYLDWAVKNLRVGGTVLADNAFRGGRILSPQDSEDRAMVAFNETLANHPMLESTIIDVGDGLAVGVKVRD